MLVMLGKWIRDDGDVGFNRWYQLIGGQLGCSLVSEDWLFARMLVRLGKWISTFPSDSIGSSN